MKFKNKWQERFHELWEWLPESAQINAMNDIGEKLSLWIGEPDETIDEPILNIGMRVKVKRHRPPYQRYFCNPFIGIINNVNKPSPDRAGVPHYFVFRLDDDDNPVGDGAWYPSNLLIPISQDKDD